MCRAREKGKGKREKGRGKSEEGKKEKRKKAVFSPIVNC